MEFDLDELLGADLSGLDLELPAKAPPAKAATAAVTVTAAPAPAAPKASKDDFTLSSFRDHMMTKGMWAGALEPVVLPDLLGAEVVEHKSAPADALADVPASAPAEKLQLREITSPHTPALLKGFDEVIVNATDHAKGCEHNVPSQRVTVIDISFEPATGRITVRNDGPGIPVKLHTQATADAGRAVYLPEVAFAYFLAGTNIVKERSNVKGGINGLGAKVANVHSVEFAIETLDAVSRQLYRQTWRNRLGVTELPELEAVGAKARPYTRVSFLPAYAALGYKTTPTGAPASAAADLEAWLRLRAHQSAAYVGARVQVSFNGAPVMTRDAAALARLLAEDGATVLAAQAKAAAEPYKAHPWSIAVVILPAGHKAGRRASAQNMTLVNGVVCNKGAHVRHFREALSAAIEARLRRATKAAKGADEKKMSTTETLAGIRFVACGALPGADWGGQRKDELQVKKEALSGYVLPAAFLKQVSEAVAERLLATTPKTSKFVHDKYTPAKHAGKAQRPFTALLAAEGDSAITLLRAGLTQRRSGVPPGGPSLEWCGMISLQGVVPNAAREVTELETSDGDTLLVRSAKLRDNKRLAGLADALGLRYDCRYETAAERATLKYGRLLLCVDQDLDGTGKIAALVLVWVHQFWPALLSAGFVGRFVTPVARVYPKSGGAPLEYFYEFELEEWLAGHPNWRESHRDPIFYKGLGAHTEAEIPRMFAPEAFQRSIHTYIVDESSRVLFDVFFGPDASRRRTELATPVRSLSVEIAASLVSRREIPLGRVQLQIDTKLYKNEAIRRQLPGAIDGLNPARRKTLMGAALRFKGEGGDKSLKIFQLGGSIADKMAYHHGDASLNATIAYMAQNFIGARRFPYLIGVGQFGSRHNHKPGSARYIGVRLAALFRAVFPPADRWLLDYVFEDGARAEPRSFVPVVPMTALESYRIVSEGWNHDSYARDFEATLAAARDYARGEPVLTALAERLRTEGATPAVLAAIGAVRPLPPCTRGFRGSLRPHRGITYSYGVYAWDAKTRTVAITELPVGVVTDKYLETIRSENPRYAFVEDVDNQSPVTEINILVRLKPGAYEALVARATPGVDPLEEALLLRAPMRDHLNYYAADGGILELGSCYLAAVLVWAPFRRDLYAARVERERLIAELRILEESEILRYIPLAEELGLAKAADDLAAAAVLRSHGFRPIRTGLLHKPEYTPNSELRARVLAEDAEAFDYLLNLRGRDLVRSAQARREKTLAALRLQLAKAEALLTERPIACGSLWLAEIDAFEAEATLRPKTAAALPPRAARVSAPVAAVFDIAAALEGVTMDDLEGLF